MTGPVMTVGKNLSGIDLLRDRQQLITKLYPRGSGSTPSELTLDNPSFWPAGAILELNRTDNEFAYFRLPKVNGIECSTYMGDPGYGDGWPINTSFCIGENLSTLYDVPAIAGPAGAASIGSPADAFAVAVYLRSPSWGPFRVYDVSFKMQRLITPPGTVWTTQPRFVVGLYSCTPSVPNTVVNQPAGYVVPHQGPLTWCYGNLLSIASDAPQWYSFPLQAAQYPLGWYAIVVAPYPTSNKQWSVNDYLGVAKATADTSGLYAEQCRQGITPKNWIISVAAGGGVDTPIAFKLRTYANDVTTQFKQSDSRYPGREVKLPLADYDSSAIYPIHYAHTGYLISWDA